MVTFSFLPPIQVTQAALAELGLDIRSFREPLKRSVQRVMSPSFRQNFEQEGRPEPWAPLSDDTVERRGREGYGGGPILTRSGALKKTVQQLNIWTITRTDATINGLPPRVAYGMVHQQGGFGGGFGRPFLVMQPEDEDAIELVFNEWVAERIAMRWSGRGL